MISIVSPVYNASKTIQKLIDGIEAAMQQIGEPFEIILIDDASQDNSWDLLQELAAERSNIIVARNKKNLGQHPTIFKALDKSHGDWIVVMDCDLQDRPNEIINLFRAAQIQSVEAVLGQRKNRNDSWIKNGSSRLFYKVYGSMGGYKMDASVANFGIYSRKLVDAVLLNRMSHFFPLAVQKTKMTLGYVAVEHAVSVSSNYTWLSRVQLGWGILKNELGFEGRR